MSGSDAFYDDEKCAEWRHIRLNLIESHFGKDYFRGKTVLEVAAAWGHIGAHFQRNFGAIVTCTDHFERWVGIIQERYPEINAFVQNVNDPWTSPLNYDVLIHMGVIYHQPAEIVEPRLREACKVAKEMIIETDALPLEDPYYIERLPRPDDLWEPFGTEYCRPSTAFIERILLEEGLSFIRFCYAPNRFMWFCKPGALP